MTSQGFLVAERLEKRFPAGRRRFVHAVRDVSLSIAKGSTLAVVGESGCGKSTLGRLLLRLVEPTSGRVLLDGTDVTAAKPKELRALRRKMQMIFQDPFGALDPRLTIGEAVREAFDVHEASLPKSARHEKALALLARVGIRADQAASPPSAFSGGMRQRAVIARALAVDPAFVFADEPVSALDVSIQAQIVNLLLELQEERGLTYLFVSHDLKVVEHVTRARDGEVAVMYLGRVVERARAATLFTRPAHPYTRALLSAVPGRKHERIVLEGELPSPLAPPSGCAFHPRCPLRTTLSPEQRTRCDSEEPALRQIGDTTTACHWA